MGVKTYAFQEHQGQSAKIIGFLGVRIDLLTDSTLMKLVSDCISQQRKIVIAHHNLHSLCYYNSSTPEVELFRSFYESANYTLADGMSIVLLGQLNGHLIRTHHRIAYNDWLPMMLPLAVENAWRIYYLGSTPSAAADGEKALNEKFPGLWLEVHHGHFDASPGSASNSEVLEDIAKFRPHFLFVGMGVPRQERWIHENLESLEANIILTSGATLDYIAGQKHMAPRWMGKIGLEWAFRLITEPRRLAFRYLVEPWGLLGAVLRKTRRANMKGSGE